MMVAPAERSPERVVLVVDDEDTVRRITARTLTEAGFRVLEARDAAGALRLLAALGTHVVWLVVSDVAMPGMTGHQLAEVIAQQWPEVQVLLYSGRGGPSRDFTGLFLPKPFTPDTLVAAVSTLLPPSKARVG